MPVCATTMASARPLTQGHVFDVRVNIYKALGGGWADEADKLAPRLAERAAP